MEPEKNKKDFLCRNVGGIHASKFIDAIRLFRDASNVVKTELLFVV